MRFSFTSTSKQTAKCVQELRNRAELARPMGNHPEALEYNYTAIGLRMTKATTVNYLERRRSCLYKFEMVDLNIV